MPNFLDVCKFSDMACQSETNGDGETEKDGTDVNVKAGDETNVPEEADDGVGGISLTALVKSVCSYYEASWAGRC